MAPMSRHPAKVYRGPNRSQAGPATRRTSKVATKAMMLELPTWAVVKCKSLLIMSWSSGGKAYLVGRQQSCMRIDVIDDIEFEGLTYQDQNAIMKPNQEKKNTRPWILITLNRGTERALWLIGLSSGAFQSNAGLKPTIVTGQSGG
jgi:hypothetical protein